METAADKINALAERLKMEKRVRNGFENGGDVVDLLDAVVTRVLKLEVAVMHIGTVARIRPPTVAEVTLYAEPSVTDELLDVLGHCPAAPKL